MINKAKDVIRAINVIRGQKIHVIKNERTS